MPTKGVVLLSVIMILLTIAVIGASLVAFFSSVSLSAGSMADEAKALYLAEAGIAYAIHMLRNPTENLADFKEEIGPFSLGEGDYRIKFDLVQSLITSTGNVRGIRKTVQLQYSAL